MRKMKKFSEGGRAARGQARYDRMVKDIESDYAKKKDKPGRAGEVAKAKYEQRMADAKDDLAKARGEDRSQTRAAEKAAERNLTTTRKFGAFRPAVKADETAKVSSDTGPAKTPAANAAPEKKAEPQKFGDAFRAARSAGNKTFTWQGKSYTTKMAGEGSAKSAAAAKPAAAKPAAAAAKPANIPTGNITFGKKEVAAKAATPKPITFGKANVPTKPAVPTGGITFGKADVPTSPAAIRAAAERKRREELLAKRRKESAAAKTNMASGGTVKKKPTPPQPTPAERAASKRQDESFKTIKPSQLSRKDKKAMESSGSSGYKKGGMVMKKAAKFGSALVKKSDDTKGRAMVKKAGGGKCYAKGGSVSSRADGVAHKGKTKGKMVTMSKGGKY